VFTRIEPWTVDDLYELPDDGMRHELVDGSLVISARPAIPHARVLSVLQAQLVRQAPAEFAVEVLSPDNKGHDLVTKRHFYAQCGIPQYWIIDQQPAPERR
jgi:Uma2 family endonuclease